MTAYVRSPGNVPKRLRPRRIDVFTAANDHIVDAAQNEEITVLVNLSSISGVIPSISNRARLRIRALQYPENASGELMWTTISPSMTLRRSLIPALPADAGFVRKVSLIENV